MKTIYLHGENSRDIKKVAIDGIAEPSELFEIFSREFVIETGSGDYLFFKEDDVITEDDEEIIVETELVHLGHYHYHRCRSIKTEVTYNGVTKDFKFKPSATGNKVLKTSVKAFSITPGDSVGLILKIDDNLILKPTDHIGSFAGHHDCKLSLLLTPDKVIQG